MFTINSVYKEQSFELYKIKKLYDGKLLAYLWFLETYKISKDLILKDLYKNPVKQLKTGFYFIVLYNNKIKKEVIMFNWIKKLFKRKPNTESGTDHCTEHEPDTHEHTVIVKTYEEPEITVTLVPEDPNKDVDPDEVIAFDNGTFSVGGKICTLPTTEPDWESCTKAQLLEAATQRKIPNRSKMTKEQLVQQIRFFDENHEA